MVADLRHVWVAYMHTCSSGPDGTVCISPKFLIKFEHIGNFYYKINFLLVKLSSSNLVNSKMSNFFSVYGSEKKANFQVQKSYFENVGF
jgi:hypothetical protein